VRGESLGLDQEKFNIPFFQIWQIAGWLSCDDAIGELYFRLGSDRRHGGSSYSSLGKPEYFSRRK